MLNPHQTEEAAIKCSDPRVPPPASARAVAQAKGAFGGRRRRQGEAGASTGSVGQHGEGTPKGAQRDEKHNIVAKMARR